MICNICLERFKFSIPRHLKKATSLLKNNNNQSFEGIQFATNLTPKQNSLIYCLKCVKGMLLTSSSFARRLGKEL